MPLSFVIARYFAYAFAAVATAWLASFMALSAAINAGFVYEASWGPANAREVAEGLARDGVCGQQDVPTAYRYLILNKDGYVLMTDLEGTRLEDATEMARAALAANPGTVEIEGGGSGLTYAAFPLEGGGACALVSEYLPQWVSRDLAGLLPNPQDLMLAGAAGGSALALALVARRASRVISRKMAPLAEAAGRVGAGELDFAVGSTNVREVNDVLAAMDAMRASLAESLEARWAAERGQREQVASLAHDLKTPLTVLRANADFVAEELEDEKDADLAAAARDIAGSVERLDGYVRLLIEASRGSGGAERAPMRPAELCEQVLTEAAQIARARGVTLDAATGPAVAGALDWQHLFGRFREGQPRLPELDRRHVAQRRVDPEVVVPVHVVRELGPELARRAERLAVDELGLQYPVGRLVDGVVVGAALGRQRPLNAEGLEHQVDLGVVELAAAVRVEDLDVRDGEGERRERRLDQPGVLPGPGGVADDLPVVEVDEQADVVPRGPDAHVGQVAAYMGARRPAAEAARDDVGHVGLVDRPGVHLEPLPAVCADQAVLPHDAADPAPADGDARPLERRLYLARAVPALAGGVGRDHGRRGGVRRGGPVGPRAHGVVRRPRDAEEPALR